MKKLTPIIGLVLLFEAGFALTADAARAAHRPWMAHKSKASRPLNLDVQSAHEVAHKFVSTSDKGDKGELIAAQAKRYRGTKYRFGGESKSKGLDCSGLIRRVYDDLNLTKLPRTSGQLYRMGDPIHLNELQPGDLVFFKNTYKRGVSHVGVYAGDNRFVHAQNRRHGVTMTSLADPYYQLHYAGARRLY